MNKITNPRQLAVLTLTRTKQGAYSNLQVDTDLKQADLSSADRRLYTSIVYGVLQHQMTFEYQLAPFLKNPAQVDEWVVQLLYTAMYQMEYLDRIPKRAIFDETIKVAKKLGHDGIRRMVTGVLHAMDRKKLADPKQITDLVTQLAITNSVPQWIVELLIDQLGQEKATTILMSLNQPPKQSVRANLAIISRDELLAQLNAAGYDATASEVASEGIIIEHSETPITQSDFFIDGKLTVQDESAMLPAEAMTIEASDLVLDACAAPGGKTTQMATRLKATEKGQVVALDIHKNKMKPINQNAKRLHVNEQIVAQALDARNVGDVFEDDLFDEILVDAPCSGFGLMRRKPEIRYQKTPADIEKLSQIQLAILNAVAPKLKVGGQLTYSTCTIVNQENKNVIDQFVINHPEFEVQYTHTDLDLKADRNELDLRIYPDDYLSDGFYVCTLIKQ